MKYKFLLFPTIVCFLTLSSSLFLVLQPLDILIRHLKDDAFYYFKVANNIALGYGSTFDGINKTNGYHPLWMLNIIPVYLAFPHNLVISLRVIVVLAAVYHTIAAILLYYTIERISRPIIGCLTALAWALCPITMRINLSGMESALYSVLIAILIYHITNKFKDNNGLWNIISHTTTSLLSLGFIIGLAILARLDGIYIFAGILFAVIFPQIFSTSSLSKNIRAVLIMSIPVALLLGLYLLSNIIYFGHTYPVSGYIKRPSLPNNIQDFIAQLLWPFIPIYQSSYFVVIFVLLGMLLVIIIASLLYKFQMRQALIRTLHRYDWLICGDILLYIHMSLSKTYIYNWYYVPFLLLLAVIFAEIVAIMRELIPVPTAKYNIAYSVILLLLIGAYVLIGTVEFAPNKNDYIYNTYQSAFWIRDNLPKGAIGASWNAGIIGYFSGRQIVNLDGLINSYDYYAAMQAGQEPEFVARDGVTFVFDTFPVPESGNSASFFPSPQWKPYLEPYYEDRYPAHNIGISSYFTPVFPTHERDAVFMFKVWKLKPVQ